MVTNIELESEAGRESSKRWCIRFYVTGRKVPIDFWIYGTQDKLSFINSLLDLIKAVMFYDQR